MPIYASPETMADIQRVFRFAFDGTARFPGYIHPEPHLVDGPFRIGETEITPLPVPHGRIRSTATCSRAAAGSSLPT